MKRAILAVIAIAVLSLYSSVDSYAQASEPSSREKQTVAPQRHVIGRTLVSDIVPPISIKFDKDFKYVGTQSFILYNSAQVEQFFFIAASRNRIKRMFMVQFEGYLPDNTHTYKYEISNTVKLGGLDFMYDTSVANVPAFRKQYPDSDAARAAAFLEAKGYHLEGEDIVYQRFVRLVDDAHRNELLIIYYENLNGMGLTAADLSEKGRAARQREKLFQEVMNRALKSFTVWQPMSKGGVNNSVYTEDEKHKLFQAVGITQDPALILEVSKKLGLIGSNNAPTEALEPFVNAHYGWAEKNKAWVQEHLSREKAREYAMSHK